MAGQQTKHNSFRVSSPASTIVLPSNRLGNDRDGVFKPELNAASLLRKQTQSHGDWCSPDEAFHASGKDKGRLKPPSHSTTRHHRHQQEERNNPREQYGAGNNSSNPAYSSKTLNLGELNSLRNQQQAPSFTSGQGYFVQANVANGPYSQDVFPGAYEPNFDAFRNIFPYTTFYKPAPSAGRLGIPASQLPYSYFGFGSDADTKYYSWHRYRYPTAYNQRYYSSTAAARKAKYLSFGYNRPSVATSRTAFMYPNQHHAAAATGTSDQSGYFEFHHQPLYGTATAAPMQPPSAIAQLSPQIIFVQQQPATQLVPTNIVPLSAGAAEMFASSVATNEAQLPTAAFVPLSSPNADNKHFGGALQLSHGQPGRSCWLAWMIGITAVLILTLAIALFIQVQKDATFNNSHGANQFSHSLAAPVTDDLTVANNNTTSNIAKRTTFSALATTHESFVAFGVGRAIPEETPIG